jgi:hypothetical protein
MISFRLTDEEYVRFRRLCVTRGLRNVSELVRSAVNQLIDDTSPSPENSPSTIPGIQTRVEALESRLAGLAVAVAQMESRLLSAYAGPVNLSGLSSCE